MAVHKPMGDIMDALCTIYEVYGWHAHTFSVYSHGKLICVFKEKQFPL